MPGLGASRIQAMLNRVGVPIVLGGTTVKGALDNADSEEAFPGGISVAGTEVRVAIKTGALPGLAHGSSVTVDGTAYRVLALRKIGDGEVTVVYCGNP